jgi:hypothetical protein
MNDYKRITIPLDNDRHIGLMFLQFQSNGDWICQANDEFMTDISRIMEQHFGVEV